jgi:hypothetical protein
LRQSTGGAPWERPTAFVDRHDMIDHAETADSTEPTQTNEPIDSTDPNDPMEPIESADPVEPMDSTESFEQMLSTEPSDLIDHLLFIRPIMPRSGRLRDTPVHGVSIAARPSP